MRVLCDDETCLYNRERECQKEMLWIEDDECSDYKNYIESPDYQSVFYVHIKDPETGNHYKVRHTGKRFEFYGHVFYTSDDDRYGITEMWFTEEVTGYGLSGKYFWPELSEENKQKYIDALNEMIGKAIPVKDLPEKEETT